MLAVASLPGLASSVRPRARWVGPVETIKKTSGRDARVAGASERDPHHGRMVRRSHRVRDIAEQAGAVAGDRRPGAQRRPGVSARAVRAVEAAVLDLERQQSQVRLSRRTLLVDVVLDAPGRFRDAVRAALEDGAAVARARPRCGPASRPSEGADARGASPRSSTPGRRRAGQPRRSCSRHPTTRRWPRPCERARQRGIPIVTLVTDVSGSRPGGLRRARQRGGRRDGRLPRSPTSSARPMGPCSRP